MTEKQDNANGSRFRIYAITRRDGREMVRWTDTKLKKDHHEPTERLLSRCELGVGGAHQGGRCCLHGSPGTVHGKTNGADPPSS